MTDGTHEDETESTHTKLTIIVGELLFEFSSFQDWVNKAKIRFSNSGFSDKDVLCVDQKGRLLQKGKEFMRARDDNSFPVKVYVALIQED